ncbi:HlyD family secretion protein [Telmatospirillum sp.]|uniref:HlyD family secretion protein n=1 Tax=Telmatospirillum sp. TaxID=2079197 RepID=UPI00283BD6EC|nr:HlyD family secretion protein [Telmatospirillum sp.]MDR3439060.1 HlyD family secretion protein [Telmatospirillum sp.]
MTAAVAAVLGGGWYYLTTNHQESTDDAFTDGRAIAISPKVSGYVSVLAVDDNQYVTAGQVLAEIDARDYQIARDKARASLHLAEAQLASARINARMARIAYPADLASAQAQRESAAASLIKAEADFKRQQQVDRRATTQQDVDQAAASERAARATVADAAAKLHKAAMVDENVAAADAQVGQSEGQVAEAAADLAQAELNLSHTRILAPQDGWVTKRNVEQGAYVQPGQSLMAVVSSKVWVTANFKESQLRDMRPGQRVDIALDAYPQLHLTGKVDTIQMGSGSRFSAFPAENATGNYIKIVQRIPVKITIESGFDPKIPLPLGLSVIPTVYER